MYTEFRILFSKISHERVGIKMENIHICKKEGEIFDMTVVQSVVQNRFSSKDCIFFIENS